MEDLLAAGVLWEAENSAALDTGACSLHHSSCSSVNLSYGIPFVLEVFAISSLCGVLVLLSVRTNRYSISQHRTVLHKVLCTLDPCTSRVLCLARMRADDGEKRGERKLLRIPARKRESMCVKGRGD